MKPTTCSILLVDDDKSWQNINKIVLGRYGYQIYIASDKQEALSKIKEKKYEIAVVDLRLIDNDPSNFDGIEIIKRLRRMSPKTRILVKSGYLSLAAESELRNLGIDKENVFDKGTSNKELAERIERIFEEINVSKEGK